MVDAPVSFKTPAAALSWAAEFCQGKERLKLKSESQPWLQNASKRRTPSSGEDHADKYKMARAIMAEVMKMPEPARLLLLYYCLGDRATPEWFEYITARREALRRKGQRLSPVYNYTPELIAKFSGQDVLLVEKNIKDALQDLSFRLSRQGVFETPTLLAS